MKSTDQDAAKLFLIQSASGSTPLSLGFTPWTLEEFRLELNSPQNKVFYMEQPSSGFIFYRCLDSEIEILHLAVKSKGQGWGSHLLRLFFSELKKIYSPPLCIFLEVSVANLPAIKCYEKNDFERLSIRKHYYKNGDDALTMKKDLL